MPRYPRSKFQMLSPSKQQALLKGGVTIFDDSGGASGTEDLSHESAWGPQGTTLDHSPAKDPRFKNRHVELQKTGGRDALKVGHSSGASGLEWQRPPLQADVSGPLVKNVKTGKAMPAVTPEEAAAMDRTGMRLAGAAIMAPLGGPVGQQAMSASAPVLGNLLGQAVGVAAGDYAGQLATPQAGPTSWKESVAAGGMDFLTGGAMHGAGYVLGRAGGVSKEAIRKGALRPNEIFQGPVRDEYYDLAHDISRDAAKRMDPTRFKTQPRQDLEAMYAAHAASGQQVDAVGVVQALDNQIRGLANPQDTAIDATLAGFRDRLLDRIGRMSPSGMMTAPEVDQLIREEMGGGLKKFYETLGGSAYIKRVARARGEAVGGLYNAVDPSGGAAALGKKASQQLRVTERVHRLVPVGGEVREITSSPQALRAAMNPQNVGKGVALERALKAYDKLHKTSFFQKMNELSLREQWTPLERESATEMAGFVLATGYRNRGALQRSATYLGKGAVKAGVPSPMWRAVSGDVATQALGSLFPSHDPTQ